MPNKVINLKTTLIGVFIFFSIICSPITNQTYAKLIELSIEPQSGLAPLEVTITCITSRNSSTPRSYSIDFGDGTRESVKTNEYTYTFTHTYPSGYFRPVCTVEKDITEVQSDPGKLIVAKWRFKTGGEIDSSPAIGPDGHVYVGSDNGYIYALDPENGTEMWRFKTGGEVQSSPAVGPLGTIYVGSSDNRLYALKPNGSLKWSFNIGDYIFSSPAIGPNGRTIYVGASDGYLYALSASGTLKWKFQTNGDVVSSPSIGHDGIENVVYFGSTDRHVYAVAADNGALKWAFPTDAEVYASPAIDQAGRIYVGECRLEDAEEYNFKFYCLNPDGTQRWAFADRTGFYSSPALGMDGIIYVGSWDGTLFALNRRGQKIYSITPGPPPADMNSSPAIGTVGSNEVVYIGSKKDIFFALQDPRIEDGGMLSNQMRSDWSFGLEDDILFSSPVIASDGTIYFGAHDQCVYAINPGKMTLSESPWPMFRQNPSHTGLAENIQISDVISTDPIDNSQSVNREIPQIKVFFSPEIDSEQVDIEGFKLEEEAGPGETKPVEGFTYMDFTKYNNSGFRATAIFNRLDEETPLPYKTTYIASIPYKNNAETAGAQDAEEDNVETYKFKFTTEAKPKDEPTPNPSSDFGCFLNTLQR